MLTHTKIIEVCWGDCDAAAVVFYPRYYAWFDACTHSMLSHVGLEHADMQKRYDVIGTPLVAAKAAFRAPATYGDMLSAVSTVSEVRRKTFVVSHVLKRGETLICEGEETRVWARRHPEHVGQMQAAPLPADVLKLLKGES